MKPKGYTLIELLIVLVIVASIGVAIYPIVKTFDRYVEAKKIKPYLESVSQAALIYSANNWQDCTTMTSLSLNDLIDENLINVNTNDYITDIELATDIDNTNRTFPISFLVTASLSDERVARLALADIPHSTLTVNGNNYEVSAWYRVSPLAHSSRNNDYVKQQLPIPPREEFCFNMDRFE